MLDRTVGCVVRAGRGDAMHRRAGAAAGGLVIGAGTPAWVRRLKAWSSRQCTHEYTPHDRHSLRFALAHFSPKILT